SPASGGGYPPLRSGGGGPPEGRWGRAAGPSSRNEGIRALTERAIRTPRGGDVAASGVLTPAQRAAIFLSRIWAWVFLGLMVLFFVVAVPLSTGGSVNFLTVRNFQNILVAIVPVLLLGLGQTFVIITAGIDLSVGWVMSLASVLSALAIRGSFNSGLPLFPSVLVGLA